MRTQTTGGALVLTGTGIVLAGIIVSALWTWIPNKAVWGDWVFVGGWSVAAVGFWGFAAYSVWFDLKPRQQWFPVAAACVLMLSSVLFFIGGAALGDLVAFLGVPFAAAIAWWMAQRSR